MASLAELPSAPPRGAVVYAPSFFADDAVLLVALRNGQRGARAVFHRRHVDDVERLLRNFLGPDPELSTHVLRAFARAFRMARRYRGKPEELPVWLSKLVASYASRVLLRQQLRSGLRGALRLLPVANGESRARESGADAAGYGLAERDAQRAIECERLLNQIEAIERRQRVRQRWVGRSLRAAALAGVALLALFLGAVGAGWSPRALVTSADARFGGTWLAAVGTSHWVELSRGMSVELLDGARVRVLGVEQHAAWLTLESGEARGRFSTADDGWQWDAGPYSVRGERSELRLSWEPATQRFEIAVQSGPVRIEGPGILTDYTLASGEQLRLTARPVAKSPANP